MHGTDGYLPPESSLIVTNIGEWSQNNISHPKTISLRATQQTLTSRPRVLSRYLSWLDTTYSHYYSTNRKYNLKVISNHLTLNGWWATFADCDGQQHGCRPK